MGTSKPRLVIVSGAPASGKTTLGRRLAAELGLIRLCKDELREVMGDWMAPTTHAESRALGGAAYALCVRVGLEALERGAGVLVEAAFSRGSAEGMLAPLVERSRAVLIHLSAPADLSDRRFRERYARGERHPAHMDALTVAHEGPLFEAGWERWERPLDLGVPTLDVDTSGGYVDDLGEIVAFIERMG